MGRRGQFHYPVVDPEADESPPCVYLCGNSLGLQPVKVAEYVNEELRRWSRGGVRGHFEGAGRCGQLYCLEKSFLISLCARPSQRNTPVICRADIGRRSMITCKPPWPEWLGGSTPRSVAVI